MVFLVSILIACLLFCELTVRQVAAGFNGSPEESGGLINEKGAFLGSAKAVFEANLANW